MDDDQENFYIDDDISSFMFAKDETESSSTPIIKLEPPKPDTNNEIKIVSSDDEIQVTKFLNNTDVEMISKPTTGTYIKTTSVKNRRLKNVIDHPYNRKQDVISLNRPSARRRINKLKDNFKTLIDSFRKKDAAPSQKSKVEFIKQTPSQPRKRLKRNLLCE